MAAKIPRATIERYMAMLNQLSATARRNLERTLAQYDLYELDEYEREEVADIFAGALGISTWEAAELAAIFYTGMRAKYYEGDSFFEAEPESGFLEDVTKDIVNGLLGKLGDGYTEVEFINTIDEMVDREMKNASGKTIISNADRDPARPRYARIPTGAETCAFCWLLASRGFVYTDEDTAGGDIWHSTEFDHYHAYCDCAIVPEFDADGAEGYDSEDYKAAYKEARKHTISDTEAKKKWDAMTSDEQKKYKNFSDYYSKLILHTMREMYGLK